VDRGLHRHEWRADRGSAIEYRRASACEDRLRKADECHRRLRHQGSARLSDDPSSKPVAVWPVESASHRATGGRYSRARCHSGQFRQGCFFGPRTGRLALAKNPTLRDGRLHRGEQSSRPHGLSTTLMQPSSLSRNVLYMPGPCSSGTVCVITNDGSICPSRIRRNRSSVQRLT
jgi:hypothetical protein